MECVGDFANSLEMMPGGHELEFMTIAVRFVGLAKVDRLCGWVVEFYSWQLADYAMSSFDHPTLDDLYLPIGTVVVLVTNALQR